MNINVKKDDICAYLWPLLFWKVLYIKPILLLYEHNSQMILLILNIILLVIFICSILSKDSSLTLNNGHLLLLVTVNMFLMSILINPNHALFNYIYKYYSGPFLLILFALSVKDYEALLKNYTILAIIAVLIYAFMPLFNMNIFSDYMDFGYSIMMPGFFGIYIARKYFKIKWLFPIEVICWFLIIAFSSRGAILGAVALVLLYNIFIEQKNAKTIIKLVLLGFAAIIIYYNLANVFMAFDRILKTINYNSYSINKLRDWLIFNNSTKLLSGRDVILGYALKHIEQNILTGSGIGTFEVVCNTYSHNIIMDFMLYWGLWGFLAIIFILAKGFKIIKNETGSRKVTLILLLCMWFPKLLFTGSFLFDPGFQVFLALITINNKIGNNEDRR